MSADKRPDTFSDYLEQQLVRYRAVSVGVAVFAFVLAGRRYFGWILDNSYLKPNSPSARHDEGKHCCLPHARWRVVHSDNDRSPSRIKRGTIQLFAAEPVSIPTSPSP